MNRPFPPSEGQRVLFCAHADVDEFHIDISLAACPDQPFHWYCFENPGERVWRQSDGETFTAHWVALCDSCQRELSRSGVNIAKLIAQDAPWIGEPPQITPWA